MDAAQADEFLVEQIRRGEQAAWHQFICRFEGRLQAFARVRLSAHADAEDVVQETFIGFVQSLTYYDATRSLETYLFAILRNKINDLLKKRASAAALPGAGADPADDLLGNVAGPTETPSHYAASREQQARLAGALGDSLRSFIRELEEKEKFEDLQVVELSFYVGRRNKDIGELLDLDEKHVAGVKFRAIRRIQELIQRTGLEFDADELERSVTDLAVAEVWRERRITCLKRSTLGGLLLGVLDEPWRSYAQFHLDVVGCPICVANLEDLRAEADESAPTVIREQIFASSVGFLSASPPSGGA